MSTINDLMIDGTLITSIVDGSPDLRGTLLYYSIEQSSDII